MHGQPIIKDEASWFYNGKPVRLRTPFLVRRHLLHSNSLSHKAVP